MSTSSLFATAGCWRARWAPAAVLTLLGCAGCSHDGASAAFPGSWAPRGAVHRAFTDAVTLGAVIIDRVQLEPSPVGLIQQDRDASPAVWVELVNPGNEAVRMGGFGLSDQKDQPFRWVFPADAVLAAGGRLGVWLAAAPDAATPTVRVTAPNGTAAGVLLDSTQALRPSGHAAWCRQNGGAGGARFMPCAVAEVARSGVGRQALAGLSTGVGSPDGRE